MSLPKLEVPTFTLTLQSTKEKITYRPFLVKEEKILLMALESNDGNEIFTAVQNIITACIMEGKVNVSALPTFDLEYLFLKIRSKSVGETSDISIPCTKCEAQNKHTIKLDDVELNLPKEVIEARNYQYNLLKN